MESFCDAVCSAHWRSIHRPEWRDTSGNFNELPALNLKARQGTVRQTIEKMAEMVKKGLRFAQLLIS